MIPRSFAYHDPSSLDEVLTLLGRYGEEARLMAGGQSLLPMMKLRLSAPPNVVDLWKVRGLDAVHEVGGELRIGALVTHRALEDSALVRARCPILARAAAVIGDPQVRNLGTLGGAAVHADPAADYPPVLVALGATLVVRSARAERTIEASDFFRGIFATDLRPDEMVVEIRVPALGPGVGWEYHKLSRRASDFALVSVAALVRADGRGATCAGADVVLGAVAPAPLRARAVEAALRGAALERRTAAAAARATDLGADVPSDVHADAAYRREVAPVCVRRALEAAISRIQEGRR